MGLADRMYRAKTNAMALSGGYTIRDWVPPRTGPYGLELHAPLANYEGPRTDVMRRLREGVKPTTNTDAAAKQHDIQYYRIGQQLARGVITRPQAIQQVKTADNKLMKSALVNKLSVNPVENMHANLALAGIAGKKALQALPSSIGMDELKFVDPRDKPDLPGDPEPRRLGSGTHQVRKAEEAQEEESREGTAKTHQVMRIREETS